MSSFPLCGDLIHPKSIETIQTSDLKHKLHGDLWSFARFWRPIFRGLLKSKFAFEILNWWRSGESMALRKRRTPKVVGCLRAILPIFSKKTVYENKLNKCHLVVTSNCWLMTSLWTNFPIGQLIIIKLPECFPNSHGNPNSMTKLPSTLVFLFF